MQLNIEAIANKATEYFTGPNSIALNESVENVNAAFSDLTYVVSKVLGAVISTSFIDSLPDLAKAIHEKAEKVEKKEAPVQSDNASNKESSNAANSTKESAKAPITSPAKDSTKETAKAPNTASASTKTDKASTTPEKPSAKPSGANRKLNFTVVPTASKGKQTTTSKSTSAGKPNGKSNGNPNSKPKSGSRIINVQLPEHIPDGSQQDDYVSRLLGSVIEYCYRTFGNLKMNVVGAPAYFPRTNVLKSYATFHVPDCWFDYSKSWANDAARNEFNVAAWYLRAALKKGIEEFTSGSFMSDIGDSGEAQGEAMMKHAKEYIRHAIRLFLLVAWPVIQDFKPRLQYKMHRVGQGENIQEMPSETIWCFLSHDRSDKERMYSVNRASIDIYGNENVEKHINCQNLIERVHLDISKEDRQTARNEMRAACTELKVF